MANAALQSSEKIMVLLVLVKLNTHRENGT